MTQETNMSFLEHLEELRRRIFKSLVVIVICFAGAYPFREKIFALLMRPLMESLPQGSTLIFTKPAEGFITYLKVALFAGLVVAFPVILYQAWKFIAPALYEHEKRVAIPFIVFGSIFFLGGASFFYFIVSPFVFKYLIFGFSSELVKPFPSIGEVLSFFMTLILAFGIVFEFPLIIFVLARLGLISADTLKRKRKYAIVINAILAAILTPPDWISMMFLTLPLLVFYEIGILVAQVFGRKREEVASDTSLP